MYVELVFEDGSHSVAMYETEEEAAQAIEANQERAKSGQPAVMGSQQKAVRVSRALVYEEHPNEFNPEQVVSTDEAKKAVADSIKALTEDGAISVLELAAEVRDLSNPIVEKEGPHDSQYKMKEKKELEVEN